MFYCFIWKFIGFHRHILNPNQLHWKRQIDQVIELSIRALLFK